MKRLRSALEDGALGGGGWGGLEPARLETSLGLFLQAQIHRCADMCKLLTIPSQVCKAGSRTVYKEVLGNSIAVIWKCP